MQVLLKVSLILVFYVTYTANRTYQLSLIKLTSDADNHIRLPLTRKLLSFEESDSLSLFKKGCLNYLTEVTIGLTSDIEDRQTFTLLLDTGSAVLWVPSIECKSPACLVKQKFDGSKSTSYQRGGKLRKYGFLDGLVIEGWESQESIIFRDSLVIQNQTFLEVQAISVDRTANIDGLLGLGFGHLTGSNYPILLESMKQQGIIDKLMFSLYLDNEDDLDQPNLRQANGHLLFGDHIDWNKIRGPMEYVPLARTAHWEIRLDSVSLVGGQGYGIMNNTILNASSAEFQNNFERARTCHNGCRAVLDTGSFVLVGPAEQVEALNSALGAQLMSNGIWYIPKCFEMATRMPELVFTINGRDFRLKPEQYLIPIDRSNETLGCVSGMRPMGKSQMWILGDLFVGNHYVMFDMEEHRVGLARLARERRGLDHFLAT